jgi:hypothetical protein
VGEDCPQIRRGERFAQTLANGGGGAAATLPLGATFGSPTTGVARQPKRLGNSVPAFGHLAAERAAERRMIVDRDLEQRQIGGHEAAKRSRHIEKEYRLSSGREVLTLGPSVPLG